MIRVLLADGNALCRAGLRAILDAMPDVEVVSEVSDDAAALRAVEELEPDVVILDAAAPELDGLAMANRVHRAAARTRTILLSMDARSDELRELRAAGVAGYLLSTAGRDELESAVRAVARGKAWYASRLTRRGFGQRNVRHLPAASPLPLTPRLRDVLRMLAEGLSSKEIGLRLGVSARTVEKHRAMLMQRLDIHSLAGLVRYAIRAGIAR